MPKAADTRNQAIPEPARNRPAKLHAGKIRPDTRTTPKTPKSSEAARRLIRAALARTNGNQRQAALLLRLPNHAQMRKMLAGTIRDTPAMRAALARADARAKRAWALIPPPSPTAPPVDRQLVLTGLGEVKRKLDALAYVVKGDDSQEAHGH